MDRMTAAQLGFRGNVKQCIEQTSFAETADAKAPRFTTMWVFEADGRLLKSRSGQESGNGTVTTYTYDPAGRLVKTATASEANPEIEQFAATYGYDASGRLSSIRSARGLETEFAYDGHGQKRRIDHYPVIESKPNHATGAIGWENSSLSFPPPSGGTVTTAYDEKERALEAAISDSSGKLTMRIVRHYDEQGHVVGDEMIAENFEGTVPQEMSSTMNEAQKKAVAQLLASWIGSGQSAYRYDSDGRVIEKRTKNGAFGDEVTTLRYNEHGDVTDEETVRTPTALMSTGFRLDKDGSMTPEGTGAGMPATRTELHYDYTYDTHGNWTQKTLSSRADASGESKVTMTIRRELTYY